MSGPGEPQKVQIYTKARPGDAWSSQPITATYYNPAELTLEKGVESPSTPGTGRDTPARQAPRLKTEKLTLELFFDTTDSGTGATAVSVTTHTDPFYALVKINPDTHTPPICLLVWGSQFPGSDVPANQDQCPPAPSNCVSVGSQRRYGFVCTVENVRQHFTLFSSGGLPLRANLTLTLAEYKPPDQQTGDTNPSSPDRTHGHVLQRGEALWQLAARYYGHGRSGEWRAIAGHNGVDDPRRLVPGTLVTVPPIR
ncbi:MAG TPA: hypothetical protein VHG28_14525 [Longimicrobiaceae bacterium]|nr:hypothetical protein [Longimicrobiaceae bacterium]